MSPHNEEPEKNGMSTYREGEHVTNLHNETDLDAYSKERVTPVGSVWRIVKIDGDDHYIVCPATGASIIPTAGELDTQFARAKAFVFDVKLFATISFSASDEASARRLLADALECADANLGEINGQTIVCEVSMDGTADLVEIDGEFI